jgi:hypothetical protein
LRQIFVSFALEIFSNGQKCASSVTTGPGSVQHDFEKKKRRDDASRSSKLKAQEKGEVPTEFTGT